MSGLKEVRNRIVSVNSTKQITSAMKMVSAAKLKKAQDAIVQMRPYAEKLTEILSNLSSSLDTTEGVYSQQREVKNVLIVAITSNRGLCGGFNSSVVKHVNRLISNEYSGNTVTVLSVGKKAFDAFKKTEHNIKGRAFQRNYNHIYDNLNFESVSELAQTIMDSYAENQFDRIVLVYNAFKNAATQILTTEQFLPIQPSVEAADSNNDYIFAPSKEEIVTELVPKALKTQLYKAILDSNASEHGARMTAMHKATDNASELLKELRLTYNKARQASITKEILEIVGGAEALNG